MKKLPPEMKDWYFPFNWDCKRIWSLNIPVETKPLSELEWHFDIPIWSVKSGLYFDLKPREVLENPGLHPRHDLRIDDADISYPLEMMYTVDRFAIIDGIHRLAKYLKLGINNVKVRIIPRHFIDKFEVSL